MVTGHFPKQPIALTSLNRLATLEEPPTNGQNVENAGSRITCEHGTSQVMRILGHASVLNTLATSYDILCHFS